MERTRTRIDLRPLDFSSGNKTRTPGLHLTDVIRDIMLDSGINRDNGTFDDEQKGNFQLHGYLWEDVFTEKLRDYIDAGEYEKLGLDPRGEYISLGEIAFNGEHAYFVADGEPEACAPGYIIMSPDGMRVMPERLLELKWTTLSLNMDPDKKRMEWGLQKRGYLAGLNALLGATITEVECSVLFACGDYRASGPVHEMWIEKYSLGEIADNWAMIMGHAEHKRMWEGHE